MHCHGPLPALGVSRGQILRSTKPRSERDPVPPVYFKVNDIPKGTNAVASQAAAGHCVLELPCTAALLRLNTVRHRQRFAESCYGTAWISQITATRFNRAVPAGPKVFTPSLIVVPMTASHACTRIMLHAMAWSHSVDPVRNGTALAITKAVLRAQA